MSTKKHRSPKKAAKKKQTAGTGRKSQFAGKKLSKVAKENPRREGSAGHKSFSVIKNGMTYEQFLAAGGRRTDLDWDVAHGHVKVSK